MTLKEIRKHHNLTQQQCAKYLEIPLRTYQNYENDKTKASTMKYQFMIQKMEKYGYIDEEHGVLTFEQIKEACKKIFDIENVEYCYLFGSYAKGTANEKSDVDLLIATDISGLRYFELVETLREGLKKKVDVLNQEQLENNTELVNEILKDGIKIYG